MPARLAQLVVAGLLTSGAALRGAGDEASVKLTGVTEFDNQRYALLEIVSRPGRPAIKPVLAPGEVKVIPAALARRETNPVQ